MHYLPYFIFFKSKHIPLIVGLEVIARLEPRRLCFALVNRYHAMLLFRKKNKGRTWLSFSDSYIVLFQTEVYLNLA